MKKKQEMKRKTEGEGEEEEAEGAPVGEGKGRRRRRRRRNAALSSCISWKVGFPEQMVVLGHLMHMLERSWAASQQGMELRLGYGGEQTKIYKNRI